MKNLPMNTRMIREISLNAEMARVLETSRQNSMAGFVYGSNDMAKLYRLETIPLFTCLAHCASAKCSLCALLQNGEFVEYSL